MKTLVAKIVTPFLLTLLVFSGCTKKKEALFKLLPSSDTGIDFINSIQETDSFNILTYEYIYNGGGVAIADFNNDGLQDIFFTGNEVPNKLYINQGDLKFKDISNKANINVENRWNSGVSVVDINNDGLMDIYVCATTKPKPEDRRNMLFINQGLDANKEPVFKEMAAQYKLDFNGHSVMSAFFDYDLDNDLDLFILVNVKINNQPTSYREQIIDGSSQNNDKLFRNNGDGTFTDVTLQSGILEEGFGLGLAINDFNDDGWPDIYVSNDYLSNDVLYINDKNGKFVNRTHDLIGHQSQFSMGNDAADFNNDGLPDIITLDMLPENNERKKTTIGNKSYTTYINNEKFKYDYQYVRNMLQLNNGVNSDIKFSEIGQLAGVYQTEWSWSPLFIDVDNDGFKDLLITNGFPKDITDKDFANFRAELANIAPPSYLVDSIPVVKISNYGFKNNGDLTFSDKSKEWGLDLPSFSNGAAFGDLDNDGDLDYVVNNINSEAFVYENTLYSKSKGQLSNSNYLSIKLKGTKENTLGVGAKASVYYQSKMQFAYQSIYRGYLSSVESNLHFGLGNATQVDSLMIVWPDGNKQVVYNVKANELIEVDYKNSKITNKGNLPKRETLLAATKQGLAYKHVQADVIDFNIQRTLPHKYSQYSPALSVGDINGDALDDLFIAGSNEMKGTFYIQLPNGQFKIEKDRFVSKEERLYSDAGSLFFDADSDGDQDLYVVGGGFEWMEDDAHYRHRLYKNDGRGYFKLDTLAIPRVTTSGSCVRAADFDGDGDLDLFVGGRVLPGKYPFAPTSYLLQNNNGNFTDVTSKIAPELKQVGMVTDAPWSDFNNDDKFDLVIVGELMPIAFFINNGNALAQVKDSGINNYAGWWNGISAADFDHDGDTDYVIGNLGLNNYYHATDTTPVKVFAKDFDKNGSVDALTACYSKMMDGSTQLCPVHFWDELNAQSPRFRRQFSKYKAFSKVTIDTLVKPSDRDGLLVLEGNFPASAYVENLGNNKFKLEALPKAIQFSPIQGSIVYDINKDGHEDILAIGNDFGNEVFSGKYDAFTGQVLLGNGKGVFSSIGSAKSGFYVPGDGKALVKIQLAQGPLFVASQNKDSLKVFVPQKSLFNSSILFKAQPNDSYAKILMPDGKIRKVEFYYGQGFYSQSSRTTEFPKAAKEITIFTYTGQSRVLTNKNGLP
jgi:hypothetical protein